MSEFINGPINVARLEGIVDGVHKVIYIFFEIHKNVNVQTKCHDFSAIDIQKYLYDNLKNNDKNIDVLVEIRKYDYNIFSNTHDNYTKKQYIDEITDFFKTYFDYEKKIKDNKEQYITKSSKLSNKIRLHYLDIRDLLDFINYQNHYETIYELLNNIFVKNDHINSYSELQKTFDTIVILQQYNYFYINLIKNLLNDSFTIPDTQLIDNELLKEAMSKLMKMKQSSNKEYIKVLIQGLTYIINRLDDFNKFLDTIMDYFKKYMFDYYNKYYNKFTDDKLKIIDLQHSSIYKYEKKYVKNFHMMNFLKENDKYFFTILYSFSLITDLYIINRFLTKDYITNAVIYSGALHSSQYVLLLVKYFKFNITHIFNSEIKDLNKLNDYFRKVKFADNKDKFYDYIYESEKILFPDEFRQCVDIGNFPKKFN